MEQDGFYKVIVIGDYNVGKSAILNRLCYDKFTDQYTVTVGVEYGSKEIEVDGETIQLQIWDSVREGLTRQARTSSGRWCGSSSWGWWPCS
jgi:GTPase SAR1 family protein